MNKPFITEEEFLELGRTEIDTPKALAEALHTLRPQMTLTEEGAGNCIAISSCRFLPHALQDSPSRPGAMSERGARKSPDGLTTVSRRSVMAMQATSSSRTPKMISPGISSGTISKILRKPTKPTSTTSTRRCATKAL